MMFIFSGKVGIRLLFESDKLASGFTTVVLLLIVAVDAIPVCFSGRAFGLPLAEGMATIPLPYLRLLLLLLLMKAEVKSYFPGGCRLVGFGGDSSIFTGIIRVMSILLMCTFNLSSAPYSVSLEYKLLLEFPSLLYFSSKSV